MGFEYLPWPLYALLTVGSGILGILYFINLRKKHGKILVIWITIMALISIALGVSKVTDALTGYHIHYLVTHVITSIWIVIPIILLLLVAIYIKVKDDPVRRKAIIIGFWVWIVILAVLYGLFLLSLR